MGLPADKESSFDKASIDGSCLVYMTSPPWALQRLACL